MKRNLTTTRKQVFGDVEAGTECRICGRNVEDGRSKTCSDYCDNLLSAVMGMLNWSSLRRQVIRRDDEICQACGFDYGRERKARRHIRGLIDDEAGDRPKGPSVLEGRDEMEDFDWEEYNERVDDWHDRRDELKERYGDPDAVQGDLEVDHITPIAEGGHPFDPGNLQTLCSDCHLEKTAAENSERKQTPTRGELSQSLFEYVADGGEQ